ncbi:2Fe-2S iron-sulfur cluster-binding protein [Sphingobium phenoxybenzoativorans]|uniref:Phenol hydroxylase small subunit n=1 Tax=Sphingobium phenoxybenzoativorans TaxID=1592790 RepID=A0A1W5YR17_9SPHN|nr:2Fe-2S iron-sulfur cluster-binding protein [Sphingobium phenoxybenzoativorans]ARI47610.1 phenol hydroxylase small subunit [Sphingobium phenoxybenzoativorans]
MTSPHQTFGIEVGTEHRFLCTSEQSVLGAMERGGIHAIPIGCRRGGCGACRVRIVEGEFRVGKMSSRYVSTDDLSDGIVLACCVRPSSNLVLELAPSPKCAFQPSGTT